MRRGFSIFLIVLFGVGPLSAIAGSTDAALPACCRRQGTHHCAMAAQPGAMAQNADPQPSFAAPAICPSYPGPTLAILAPMHALAVSCSALPEQSMRTRTPIAERTAANSTPGRAYAGRGPPATDPS